MLLQQRPQRRVQSPRRQQIATTTVAPATADADASTAASAQAPDRPDQHNALPRPHQAQRAGTRLLLEHLGDGVHEPRRPHAQRGKRADERSELAGSPPRLEPDRARLEHHSRCAVLFGGLLLVVMVV